MEGSAIRVLVVDDYGPWRHYVRSTLEKRPAFQVIHEVSDGAEAVRKAQEIQPDLILLDIGLPKLNGIEAARRIRECAPNSKILFISENRSRDIAEEALRAGGDGYVVKSHAASDLAPAIEAVLQGRPFVSAGLTLSNFTNTEKEPTGLQSPRTDAHVPLPPENVPMRHEMAIYRNDTAFVKAFARVTEAALSVGNPVIVIATEAHRAGILQRLRIRGVDIDYAIQEGRYVPLDAVGTLSAFMNNDVPDNVRCAEVVSDVILKAVKAAKRERPRVAICGECAPTLLREGNVEAAIRLEHMWDQITRNYPADTICGYLQSSFPQDESSSVLERICSEHSAIHGRPLGY